MEENRDVLNEDRANEYQYEVFFPKPWRLFLQNFQEMTLMKRIRFILSSITGNQIYYMKDADGEYIAYCLIEKKCWRYPDLKKDDYVISPYVVKPDLRGRGIGTILIEEVIKRFKSSFKGNLYAMVRTENLPSIAVMEKTGFKYINNAQIKGIFRKYRFDSSAFEFRVYML